MTKRLLLLSNSTSHGKGFLEHCAQELDEALTGVTRLLFIPWALHDLDAYAAKARDGFRRIDRQVISIHEMDDPVSAVESAEAIFVGGGNTFRLLDKLYGARLLEPIRARVAAGMPYTGASAGTNVACPTIMTTNDMPIVYPPSFEALGLVPFNINPHYLDPDPGSLHMGETREQRIREFHEENDPPVVGLREGTWLRVEGSTVTLGGVAPARIFRRGVEPEDMESGAVLRQDSSLTVSGRFHLARP